MSQVELTVADRRVWLRTPYALKDLVKSLPASRWSKERKMWHVPQSTWSTYVTTQLFESNGHILHVDQTEAAEYLATIDNEIIFTSAFIKNPTENLALIPQIKTEPWEHQLRAYHWVMNKRASMLYMRMGTGKTKVIIDVAVNMNANLTLIICPKAVMRAWKREVAKHASDDYEAILLDKGTTKRKAQDLLHIAKHNQRVFVVLNYESAWRKDLAKVLIDIGEDWSILTMDEIHKIKAPGGKASRFCQTLAQYPQKVVGLTGTPMPNSPLDIYAQFRALDIGVLGSSFTAFRNTYAVMGGYENRQVVAWRNQDDLNNRIYMLAYHAGDDVLDLPEQTTIVRNVTLSAEGQRAYNTMQEDMSIMLNDGEITARNVLTKSIKLRELASGFAYDDDGSLFKSDDEKEKELAEILTDIGLGTPVVVFCTFRAEIDAVHRVCNGLGLEIREQSSKAADWESWQFENDGDVLVVQIQSGQLGIDLTRSAYTVYYSLPWSLGDYDQSMKRQHRPGQMNNVTIIHLLALDTIDEVMSGSLRKKEAVVSHVLDYLREKKNSSQKMVA